MKSCCLSILLFCSGAWSQIPDSLNPYVRKPRSAAVSLEVGGNSLSSLAGIKGTFFVSPQVAVDLGLGMSFIGLRPGIYGRYLFTKGKFTPFVYGGLKYAPGFDEPLEFEDLENGGTYELTVDPSFFADAGAGIDYLADFGLYFNVGLGWSQLLTGNNVKYVSGNPGQDDRDGDKFIAGSGLGLFLSLGYAF